MGNFYLKKGDLVPRIRAYLQDANGAAIDLSGASVLFAMQLPGATTRKVSAAATIITPTAGVVEYAWQGTDTDTAGFYVCEWEVTLPGGAVMTVPNLAFTSVLISSGL